MKKNVLFIMNKLVCGGAEKSLISLLEEIDYSRYNVDLFLFKHEGMFLRKLPEEVNLLPEPKNYKFFDMPVKKSMIKLIKDKNVKGAYNRCMLGFLAKTEKNGAAIEQRFWKYLSKSIENLEKEYDAAIGFQEKNPIYFCIEKVKAKKKIGWIHTDYEKLGIDSKREELFFEKLDYLVAVSDELVRVLTRNFPDLHRKIICVKNILSSKIVKNLALEKVNFIEKSDNSVSLISVGRLAKEKGLDITLEALEILINRGHNVSWYLIGEGNMRSLLEKNIEEKKLESRVKLLGLKENPYPYIQQADIFIQTSRYEGQSIAIEEAKILHKPIVITNFATAKNHITNRKNGIIAEMNPLAVANAVESFIIEEELKQRVTRNLEKEDFGTEDEIQKLDELIGRFLFD